VVVGGAAMRRVVVGIAGAGADVEARSRIGSLRTFRWHIVSLTLEA